MREVPGSQGASETLFRELPRAFKVLERYFQFILKGFIGVPLDLMEFQE